MNGMPADSSVVRSVGTLTREARRLLYSHGQETATMTGAIITGNQERSRISKDPGLKGAISHVPALRIAPNALLRKNLSKRPIDLGGRRRVGLTIKCNGHRRVTLLARIVSS